MGSYVQNSLISGEKIQKEADINWLSQWGNFALAALFILSTLGNGYLGTALLGILFLVIAIINVTSTELAITNKKLIGKVGFIRRSSIDIPLSKIESINIDQGIIGRILGYGKVAVRGTGGNSVSIPFIKDPFEFRKTVMNVIDSMDRKNEITKTSEL